MWFLSRLTVYRYTKYNEVKNLELYLSYRVYLVRNLESYFIIFYFSRAEGVIRTERTI